MAIVLQQHCGLRSEARHRSSVSLPNCAARRLSEADRRSKSHLPGGVRRFGRHRGSRRAAYSARSKGNPPDETQLAFYFWEEHRKTNRNRHAQAIFTFFAASTKTAQGKMQAGSVLSDRCTQGRRLASQCTALASDALDKALRTLIFVKEVRACAVVAHNAALKHEENAHQPAAAAADAVPVQEIDEAPCMSLSRRLEAISGPAARAARCVTVSARAALCFATFALCAAMEVHCAAQTALATGLCLGSLLLHAANTADAAANASGEPTPDPAAVAASCGWHDRPNPEEDSTSDEEEGEEGWEQQRTEEEVARLAVAGTELRIQEQCGDDYAAGDLTILRILTDGPLPRPEHYPDPTNGSAVLRALHVARLMLEQQLGGRYWRSCLFFLRYGHADAKFFTTIQQELKARALENAPPPQPAAPPVAAPLPQPAAPPVAPESRKSPRRAARIRALDHGSGVRTTDPGSGS
jgi:hypothetical protein